MLCVLCDGDDDDGGWLTIGAGYKREQEAICAETRNEKEQGKKMQ